MTRRDFSRTVAGGALWSPYSKAAEPWIGGVFRELHIDAHFSQVPAPYRNFDAESAASIVEDAGFQMVSVFAICNGGYSYYPTRLGVVHPGLDRDFTGEFTRALKKRGVRVLAYVSVGRDRRAFPEWESSPGQMCANSPWVEEALLPQLKEIVSLCGVDGFFFDAVLGKFVRGVCFANGAAPPSARRSPNPTPIRASSSTIDSSAAAAPASPRASSRLCPRDSPTS